MARLGEIWTFQPGRASAETRAAFSHETVTSNPLSSSVSPEFRMAQSVGFSPSRVTSNFQAGAAAGHDGGQRRPAPIARICGHGDAIPKQLAQTRRSIGSPIVYKFGEVGGVGGKARRTGGFDRPGLVGHYPSPRPTMCPRHRIPRDNDTSAGTRRTAVLNARRAPTLRRASRVLQSEHGTPLIRGRGPNGPGGHSRPLLE